MSNRLLLAAGTLAALVPALAGAQQRPANPPPQRPANPPAQQPRPAAQPAQRPAQRPAAAAANRNGAIAFSIGPAAFFVRDGALNGVLDGIAGQDVGDILPGVAGSIGYVLSPKLSVGASVGFGTGSGLTLIQPSVGLMYALSPARRTSPYLVVGAIGSKWDGDVSKATGVGGGAGLGIRHSVNENVSVRVDGRVGFESYDEAGGISAIVGRAGVGVAYLMGGGPPRDTDGDGVPDKRDRCAGTVRGATVNATGCPSDTDRDGVWNGLDRCPDTPANTPVDASGCTRDADRDGIADNTDRCANTPSGVRVDATGCPVDTDRDGVADHLDRCANTAAGTPVDANGCPRDTDGDGVMENADRCPNTPAGTPVDANGCPRDSDGDGVWDNRDNCANTAAGTQVDANGCPVQRDADRDGVIDERDRCANTPAGRQVGADGCPLAELPAVGASLVLRNVLFRAGTNRLQPSSNAILDGIATAILANAGARFEVSGHTDASGVAAVNQRLSTQRAQAVVDYLVTKGISRDALTAVGHGSTRPVQPNTTAAGRAQNRRVEIRRVS